MLSIIFICIEISCKMKGDDYENKRMILRDMLLHIVEH
jgi:hypothetical protein